MKFKDSLQIFVYIILVIIAILVTYNFYVDYKHCNAIGGEMLRGFFSWDCYINLKKV